MDKKAECLNRIQRGIKFGLFPAITLVFFGPLEIMIANRNDFQFTFMDYWWINLLAAIGVVGVFTILTMVLPNRVGKILCLLSFAFTFCCYVQAMFMNQQLSTLLGRKEIFDRQLEIVNACIWLFIICLIIIPYCVLKSKDKILNIYAYVGCFISAIQVVALVVLLFTTPMIFDEKGSYVTAEGMFELAPTDNTIVFVLDSFDGGVLDDVLTIEPDILDELDGFTCFDDCSSVYARTYPSIPYLLTGENCWYDEPFQDWVDKAYEKSAFIPTLIDNDINVGLYTYSNYIGNSIKNDLTNIHQGKLKTNKYQLLKKSIKLLLYRDLPYICKNVFYYRSQDINLDAVDSSEDRYRDFQDDWFMDMLKTSQIQNVVDAKGTFRFYHLGSFHIDFDINNAIKSLHIVDEYCKQLKDKGIYDNSTIIVTADHPVAHNGDYSILFLIKPQKAEGNMQISHAPVSQTEFIGTVLQSYNLSRSSDSVFDIPKNTERDRIKYETQLKNCSDIEGETELIEYILKGNSADSENYEPTGKKWKILFSENHVAID